MRIRPGIEERGADAELLLGSSKDFEDEVVGNFYDVSDGEDVAVFHYNHGSSRRTKRGVTTSSTALRLLPPLLLLLQPLAFVRDRLRMILSSKVSPVKDPVKKGKNGPVGLEFGDERIGKANGLHWITTALFIVADMAGGGVVVLPVALVAAGGFFGAITIVLVSSAFCYTAYLLGRNWMTMCRRWPKQYCDEHCRKPYPEMAYRSMGEGARFFTSCTLNVMLYGVAIVYLLLSSKIISDFIVSAFHIRVGVCSMLLVVFVALLPVTFLKSPQDFWLAIVTAMATTAFAVIMILIGTARDYEYCAPVAEFPQFEIGGLFLSLGIFMFSFGGHGVFPTIQHDMKRPQQWTCSAILAFAIVFAMYIPIAYFGYVVYGTSLKESIITSIQSPLIQQAANLFIAAHCILTLTIVINPLNQEMEHLLKTPHHFGWQRVVIRTTTLLSIVFCAETVPSFGPILNLIGGTCVALTSAILPNMFYLFLHAQDDTELNVDAKYKDTPKIPSIKDVVQRTPFPELVLNCAVIALAIICGIATTYSALIELATSNFSSPCYLSTSNDIQAITSGSAMFHVQCCGSGNVSRLGIGPEYCPSIV